MSEVYATSDWNIKEEHLLTPHFSEFLETATELNCDLWIDWWAERSEKSIRRFVVHAPSQEAARNLLESSGANLGLANWKEVTYEYFMRVTKDGQIPSLQKMRGNNPQYFRHLREGFLMSAMT